MTISEYSARFHELSHHPTMIFPTKEESAKFFVKESRLLLY